MLTYRCGNACRHCAYRCGPDIAGDAQAWMSDDTLEAALQRLADEPRFHGLHLAGGEATLDMDRLEHALRRAAHYGVPVDYLETNGGYAATPRAAREIFRRLHRAGLRAALVSISPYHNEFIPLARTRNALAAAEEVFGANGVIPWLDHFLPLLAKLDPGRAHPLPEFLRVNGLDDGDPELLRLFPLSTGGRAPKALRKFYRLRPMEAFRGTSCADTLADTTHFHIDPEGLLFTGHCPGLAPTAVRDRRGVEITPESAPIFYLLADGGPVALADLARERHGFVPDPEGYAAACDLCGSIRAFLHRAGAYPDLRPAVFYR